MKREELLSLARRHMWAAWQLSSEELASQAADTLLCLGMLVPEGGAQELERLRTQVAELQAQRDHRRGHLVALQNDALAMRGSLSPNGEACKVPFELGETLTPAVDWLITRVAELSAVAGDPAMVCHECNAPVMWVDGTPGGWWNHTGPAEDSHDVVPRPLLRAPSTDEGSTASPAARTACADRDVTPQVRKLRALLAGQREQAGGA
ncbi:hypothetical protein ACFWGV_21725 [Bacillus subtilis]